MTQQLPIPSFFELNRVGQIWRIPYEKRAIEAGNWAKQHNIQPSANDKVRIGLLLVDVQNTFCLPEFELFVAGKTGIAAVDDNIRLCEFIYHNLGSITEIITTLDTHNAIQIFHSIFWINDTGEHPPAFTEISLEDIEQGKWKINPVVISSLFPERDIDLRTYAKHYVKKLSKQGKYLLTIWPYHAILGSIGHALVPAVEEAIFFHTIARNSRPLFEIKGDNPLTENYSVLRPEILTDATGKPIAQSNSKLLEKLLEFDILAIAGQAKSHCVVWTVQDLLNEIVARDTQLAQKVYLLEDCTSPVVIPGVIDFTEIADTAFQHFAEAGMHRVKSSDFSLATLI